MEQKCEESIAKNPKSEAELKPKFEKSIAGKTKLKKQRFSEIAKREKMISNDLFKEYF